MNLDISPPPPSPAHRRRWLTFSLRSLLLFTVVVASLLGWKMSKVNQQRRAVGRITELQGAVYFNTDVDQKHANGQRWIEPAGWLRRLVGNDFFDDVVSVRLNGKHIKDVAFLSDLPKISDLALTGTQVSDLSPLADLSNLRKLDLLAAPVRDISPLTNLTSLESLSLENTQVADIAPLAKLTDLRYLALNGTPVSDLTPLARMTKLTELKLFFCPNVRDVKPLSGLSKLGYLDVSDTKLKDLTPLSGLSGLGYLSLSRTEVVPADTQKLRTALPQCQIVHSR